MLSIIYALRSILSIRSELNQSGFKSAFELGFPPNNSYHMIQCTHSLYSLAITVFVSVCRFEEKYKMDDLEFPGFINFSPVDSDGYPMLGDVGTTVTNGLCSQLNHLPSAYWLLTAVQALIQNIIINSVRWPFKYFHPFIPQENSPVPEWYHTFWNSRRIQWRRGLVMTQLISTSRRCASSRIQMAPLW